MILKWQCIQTATVNQVQYMRMKEEMQRNPSKCLVFANCFILNHKELLALNFNNIQSFLRR